MLLNSDKYGKVNIEFSVFGRQRGSRSYYYLFIYGEQNVEQEIVQAQVIAE